MYHVKNDKRAKTSAMLIYNGLVECLKEKPYEKITITDIQNKSTVGRATFYRNFDSMIDVLHMKSDQCFKEVLSMFIASKPDCSKIVANDFLSYFFKYWLRNGEVLEILLKINRMDIIFSSHSKYSHIITEHFLPEIDLESQEYIYFMSVRTGILIGLLVAWIKTGKKESPENIWLKFEEINKKTDVLNFNL